MKYLLDTEVWLWMQANPERIGRRTPNLVSDEGTKLLLSAASAWEIARRFRNAISNSSIHPTGTSRIAF